MRARHHSARARVTHAAALALVTLLCMTTGATALHAAPAAIRADSLLGVARDSAGQPVPGVRVTITELARTAETGRSGVFVLADVPDGRYTLVLQHPSFLPVTTRVSLPRTDSLRVVLVPAAIRLAAVSVTGTRSPMSPLASPIPASEIGRARLQRHTGVSLAHVLDGVAGVRTLSTGEQVGKPMIHGLAGPRVLVLDDGLRLEDYSWSDEDGPSADPTLAARVEIVRGPASLMYGSDALGGVVNVIPEPVPDARGRKPILRVGAASYAASNNGETGLTATASGAAGIVGWRAAGVFRRGGNIHTPRGNDSTPAGIIYNTGFRSSNGELAVAARGRAATVALRYARYGGNFGLLDGPPVPADNTSGPLRRLTDDRVQLTGEWARGPLWVESRTQLQRHALAELAGESRTGSAPPDFAMRLTTLTSDLVAHVAGLGWLDATVGISGSRQRNTPGGERVLVPAARTGGGAIFATATATHARFSVLAGARYDSRTLRADSTPALSLGAQRRDAAAASGDAGIVFRPVPEVALTANVARGFRAPTLLELFTNGARFGEGRYEIGLPAARPERGTNVDAGARWSYARWTGDVTVYRNGLDGYLYIARTGEIRSTLPVYRFQQARALLTGIDMSMAVAPLEPLTLRARFDAVRGTNRATGAPLPLMPPPRADVEAELRASGRAGRQRGARVATGVEFVARQDRPGPFDTPTPAYALVRVAGSTSRLVAGWPVEVSLRVENATNRRYSDFLSRYKLFAYGPGRNVIVRLSAGI